MSRKMPAPPVTATNQYRTGPTPRMDSSFWDFWFFHLPNYAIAILIYTLLARVLLGLFVPQAWDNYIWKAFLRLTNPTLAAGRIITPRCVPPPLLVVFVLFWLMLLRVAFFIVMDDLGWAPGIEAPSDPSVLERFR